MDQRCTTRCDIPDRVKRRRDLVLSLMAEQGYITAAQKTAAQAAPLVVSNDAVDASFNYMVNVARVQAERGGVNVRDGGYRVLTTIDPGLQRAAAIALRDVVSAAKRRPVGVRRRARSPLWRRRPVRCRARW